MLRVRLRFTLGFRKFADDRSVGLHGMTDIDDESVLNKQIEIKSEHNDINIHFDTEKAKRNAYTKDKSMISEDRVSIVIKYSSTYP
jgi:hypothetical protein